MNRERYGFRRGESQGSRPNQTAGNGGGRNWRRRENVAPQENQRSPGSRFGSRDNLNQENLPGNSARSRSIPRGHQQYNRNRNDTSTQGSGSNGNYRRHNFGNDQQNNGRENDNNNNNRERTYRPRPERIMGFRYVEELVKNEDIQSVMFKLNESNGFGKLLEDKDMSDDMVVLVVSLVQKICTSDFENIKMVSLVPVLQSRFMDRLTNYIISITSQDASQKRSNKYFWNDPDQFWNHLLDIARTVTDEIPTYCKVMQTLLVTITTFIPPIERRYSIHISDSIKNRGQDLLNVVEQKLKDMEVKRTVTNVPRRYVTDDDMDPPNDFRDIDIIPSADEVNTNNRPFLRTNVIDRPYNDVDHYLDIQYRLLREDFIAPLRRGICSYLDNNEKPQDIKIYKKVRFLNVETVNECNSYRIQYDFSKKKQTFKYENSKRFMFGSLVCFTNDNFDTVLFGKIVDRDIKLLQNAQLIVGFQEEVTINYNVDYLMAESSVYFEPYYHVLNVLKNMQTHTFPMEKYIIKVETDSQVPKYLSHNSVYEIPPYRLQPLRYPAAPRRFYDLNDFQLKAFWAALTREFCIIQGPPGTGKTHLGLRIARTLLENNHAWYNQTPMLVICYTNHALDQFLEGLLPVTEKILRVGGQSKNENLKEYNLASKRLEYHKTERVEKAIFKKRDEVRGFMKTIKSLNETRQSIAANDSILNFTKFKEIGEYQNSWFSQSKQEDIFRWLVEGCSIQVGVRNRRRGNQSQLEDEMGGLKLEETAEENIEDLGAQDDNRDVEVDDIFDNLEIRHDGPLISIKQLEDKLKVLRDNLDYLNNQPENLNNMLQIEKIQYEIWENESYRDYIANQLDFYKNPENHVPPRHVDLKDPFLMEYDDRWRLYYRWVDLYLGQLRALFVRCDAKFKEVYQVYNEMREMEDTQIMKQNLVVGMTTTGAARLHSSIKALRSPIVIVEEAAEVLEAHIVAALTKYCQHLILIGDHLQLKPGAADHTIETKYRLGISLFERMVNNKIQCHTLNIQHRMRPEISRLVKPHIYPDLEDHESTLERDPILGVQKCLYFIDHEVEEQLCQDASKKNIHEAKFLIALARYLILNGYRPEQITILSAYLGQMFEMVREKKKPGNNLLLQDVRISVLDNYQGEESDIILLSLVRSNSEDVAGFLKIQNRVCVALSRARDGFYIMGNMNLLLNSKSENQIWSQVNEVLKSQNAIGPYLTLKCQNHPYRLTEVSRQEDFNKVIEGGCDLLCKADLACGHVCKRRCHVHDRDHNEYRCDEVCNKPLCEDPNHVCRKLCYDDCGPCTYLVPRLLHCGHLVKIQCHLDPNVHKCMRLVSTRLPCDHVADKPCWIDIDRFKCPHPCDTRVEPCGHACTRPCHIRVDPDHIEYRCPKPCAKPRVGCKNTDSPHICTKFCHQECETCQKLVQKRRSCGHMFAIPCSSEIEEVKCEKPCRKVMECGHKCKNKCNESCGPCREKVEKRVPGCDHKIQILCSVFPDRFNCKSKECPRTLPCGHKCTMPCASICTRECKELINCDIRSPCGHRITKLPCHLRNTADPLKLLEHCTNPCGAELKCKHKCAGTCGECKQSRIHKRCAEKCGVPLVCNHECPIPCREACKPCTQPCGMKCIHSKCKKKCGEPCTPCKNECPRTCPHVRCRKPCGAICEVPPCTERCPKKLSKCGHPCVGFCNDPCPKLCKICDKEELTEILLGHEDDPDAIYVMLNDCEHIFESSDMERWLNQNENEIKFKVCPRCSTNITTTARYSDYIKRAINDVISAKELSFGTGEANDVFRAQLDTDLKNLKMKSARLIAACPNLNRVIEAFTVRLQPVVNRRRQPINNIELNAIKSKIQTLDYIVACFKVANYSLTENHASIVIIKTLLEVLMRSIDHVTDQENEDLEFEIKRLHRIVQYEKTTSSMYNHLPYIEQSLKDVLFANKRYTDVMDITVKSFLTRLSNYFTITDQEKKEIVKAMGLQKGHWFKCPNGHPYAIGEGGGAMQVARCLCGAQIGGANKRLLASNQFAGEMDGAYRPAWPACPNLNRVIEALTVRLQPVVNRRRQPINNIELNAIKSKIQTLDYIVACFKDTNYLLTENRASVLIIKTLLEIIMRSIDHVTDQENEDLEFEIKRLHRIVQYEKTTSSMYNRLPNIEQSLKDVLFANKRYTDVMDITVKSFLTRLSNVTITDQEKMEIVKAMGLQKGHWFKCPNGHPYAIGECGGAMQVAKCLCGAQIGGTNHHLLASNQFAGEMDGAARHAWPGGLH